MGGGVPRVSDIISKELNHRAYQCFYVFYEIDNPLYSNSIKLKVDLTGTYQKFETEVLLFIHKNNIKIIIGQEVYHPYYVKAFKKIKHLYPSIFFGFFLHANPDFWQIKFLPRKSYSLNFYREFFKNIIKTIIYPFYNPYKKVYNTIYNLCDKFVLLSDSYKETYLRLYTSNTSDNKLFVIHNPSTFITAIQDDLLLNKKNEVLIVSRLVEQQKKISIALKIWHKLSNLSLKNWNLIIVGDGRDIDLYKEYVKLNNVERVYFEGSRDDVVKYYETASLFMMTSTWEGFPMSLLEAKHYGVVPIVFDSFSAARDIINDGKNGYVVEEGNIGDYISKLNELAINPDLRWKMASASIRDASRFEVKAIADRWEMMFNDFYRQLDTIRN